MAEGALIAMSAGAGDVAGFAFVVALMGYGILRLVERGITALRGPVCGCGHPAADHTLECDIEGCKCERWREPNSRV